MAGTGRDLKWVVLVLCVGSTFRSTSMYSGLQFKWVLVNLNFFGFQSEQFSVLLHISAIKFGHVTGPVLVNFFGHLNNPASFVLFIVYLHVKWRQRTWFENDDQWWHHSFNNTKGTEIRLALFKIQNSKPQMNFEELYLSTVIICYLLLWFKFKILTVMQ